MKSDLEIRENLRRYQSKGDRYQSLLLGINRTAELTFYTTCQNTKRRLEGPSALIIVTKVYEVCYDSQTAGLDL